jgi:Site-specific DNA methylase
MSQYKTPLRYPGGKQKVAPFITEILEYNDLVGGHYVEVYAGGSGVAIELLLNGVVSYIHLNDLCPAVFSFWYSILNDTEEFCRKISRASLNVEEWKKQREIIKNSKDVDRLDLGYAMFYLNRCNRSGILSGGIIGGLNQTGKWKIDARFHRSELIRRIEAIAKKRHFIKLRNWDAEKFILNYLPRLPNNTLVYCDPPYFNKSDKLYQNHYLPDDHARIAKVIQKSIKHPWIVSYDISDSILTYYEKRKKFIYTLQYNAARTYRGSEIFIFSDKLAIPLKSSVSSINQSLQAAIGMD